MKKILTLGLAMAGMCFLGTQSAHAQRITGMKTGNLANMCHSAKGYGMCDAYLSGITDGVDLGSINASNRGDKHVPMPFCVSKNVSTADMRNNFLKWAENNRDKMGKPVSEGVFFALHAAYPCPK